MAAHIIDGEFQSDKYPTTPRGKVPLSVKDKSAQDLLWEYAQRRRSVDAEFSVDLETALRAAGYAEQPTNAAREALGRWLAEQPLRSWEHHPPTPTCREHWVRLWLNVDTQATRMGGGLSLGEAIEDALRAVREVPHLQTPASVGGEAVPLGAAVDAAGTRKSSTIHTAATLPTESPAIAPPPSVDVFVEHLRRGIPIQSAHLSWLAGQVAYRDSLVSAAAETRATRAEGELRHALEAFAAGLGTTTTSPNSLAEQIRSAFGTRYWERIAELGRQIEGMKAEHATVAEAWASYQRRYLSQEEFEGFIAERFESRSATTAREGKRT